MLLSEFSTSRHPLNEFSCNTSYPFNNLEGSIKICMKMKSSQILISKLKLKQKEKSSSDGSDGNSDFYYFCFTQYLERNEQRLIQLGNLIEGKEKRFLTSKLFNRDVNKSRTHLGVEGIDNNFNNFSNPFIRFIQSFWNK
uniref:Uncharacterized protein n=1 Tax=Meloidogyne hapla TaxID=6305 RepID=A0A1I8B2Q5_MELHA